MRGEKEGTGGARERPQNDRRDAKGSTLDGRTAKATAADLQREKTPRNGRSRARPLAVFPAPKCSDIYLWWILWFRVYKREKLSLLCLRRKTTREKAKKGGGYFVSRVESTNLTLT